MATVTLDRIVETVTERTARARPPEPQRGGDDQTEGVEAHADHQAEHLRHLRWRA